MNIKEIAILGLVLIVGYYLGTNDVFARFLPAG